MAMAGGVCKIEEKVGENGVGWEGIEVK